VGGLDYRQSPSGTDVWKRLPAMRLPLPLPSESTSAVALPPALFPWIVVLVAAPPPTDSHRGGHDPADDRGVRRRRVATGGDLRVRGRPGRARRLVGLTAVGVLRTGLLLALAAGLLTGCGIHWESSGFPVEEVAQALEDEHGAEHPAVECIRREVGGSLFECRAHDAAREFECEVHVGIREKIHAIHCEAHGEAPTSHDEAEGSEPEE
jgi:hypothetical protein